MDNWAAFLSFYRSLRSYHVSSKSTYSNDVVLNCQNLNVTLRPYQEDAVKWMIHRERASREANQLSNGTLVEYPKGGILADEMGLGKTIEVLALILNNPSDYKRPEPLPDSRLCGTYDIDGRISPDMTANSLIMEECTPEELAIDYCLNRPERRLRLMNRGPDDSDISCDEGCPARWDKRKRTGLKRKNYVIQSDSDENDECRPSTSQQQKEDSDSDYEPPSSSKRSRVTPRGKITKLNDHVRSSSRKRAKPAQYCLDSKDQRKKEKYKAGELKEKLMAWYHFALDQVRPQKEKVDEEESDIRCHCNGGSDENLVRCESCCLLQHRKCVGLEEYNPHIYHCPSCWPKRAKVKSAATFIVSPDAIVHQWLEEIQRHVNKTNIKVLCYYGAKGGRYIQPDQLADQDIVITTYQSLSNELAYAEMSETRNLRHRKKYYSICTPLTSVYWYRIILDEAQMAESPRTKPAEMLQKFSATYRWAVTGTPIQKSFSDLYGLMVFLGVKPLHEMYEWNNFIETPELNLPYLYPIIWRSSKIDVLAQIDVPPPTVVNHVLKFSPTENYFYSRLYKECQVLFRIRSASVWDVDVPLNRMDRSDLNKILQPLLQVRQACTHPQVVGGQFRHLKRTMTMEELLTAMVKKVQGDVDVAVRTLVASLNGQAGLFILLNNLAEAVRLYKSVLRIPGEHPEGVIKIDAMQKIHTLYNLSLLKAYSCTLPWPEDEFSKHAEEAECLEREYLRKYQALVSKEKETLEKLNEAVSRLSDKKGLKYSDWWSKVIVACVVNPTDLMERVKCHVFDCYSTSKFQIKKSYSHKIKDIQGLLNEVGGWLEQTNLQRKQVYQQLNTIQQIPYDTLSQQAYACHLKPQTCKKDKDRNKTVCELCIFIKKLEAYEASLFEVPKHEDVRKKNSKCIQDSVTLQPSEDNRAVNELRDVTLFVTKKEGNWKPGQMEKILGVLLSYSRCMNFEDDVTEKGVRQLQICETVRKEFKSLRSLWKLICDQVAATDELAMAKLRFRFPSQEEDADRRRKLNEPNIIYPSEIEERKESFQQDMVNSQHDLVRCVGILQYLKNLQRCPNSERDPCPICRDAITDKWSVLQCGHCFCFDCIPNLMNISQTQNVECAVCRKKTMKTDVAFVDCSPDRANSDIVVNGSHSTKVEAVVRESLKIRNKGLKEKILIFSTWDKMLDLIGEAFDLNDISYKRLTASKNKSQVALDDFKNVDDVTALLMPLQRGSKGLNLIEATHVFFVEPILNPADEIQAVGRVHRIGQTKQTFVHRFIISNTIEERMLSALDNGANEEVTVRHLRELFVMPGAD